MDCKDLMVGDLVSYKDDPPYIVRGTSICEVVTIDNGIDHRNVMDDAINPIPLTEEILVKNGFEKQGDLYQYHINAGDGYTRIDIIDLQDGVWSYNIDVYDKFADAHKIHHDDDCFLKLHQLQHLMLLCGIEKEIKL